MRRAQIFSTDLILAFLLVIATFALFVNAIHSFESNAASTVDDVKMQMIASDLAALQYYTGNDLGLAENTALLGYSIAGDTCFYSTRGTGNNPITRGVCR